MFKAFTDGFWSFAGASGQAPALEMIERKASQPRQKTPVLFVHGAFAGAWCWDENFLPYFARQGVDAYAVSLRGHGRSEGQTWLQSASLADYVEDLAHAVQMLERPPVLVGHSMGGMVIQKYLERYSAPAAVLVASVPPGGLAMPTLRLMLGDPWLLTQISLVQTFRPMMDLNTARRAVFSDDLPERDLLRYACYFQPESQRAIWDMTVADLPRPRQIKAPPLLVLGAGRDTLFTPDMVEETARAYGVKAEIFPDIAHAVMLERRWQTVADRILEWTAQQVA